MTRTLCATVAAFMLTVIAAMPAALACTGSANDPIHCINNNQAITGFSDFFTSNLRSVPGNPRTSFVLTFSEPMDTATVEDNFIVQSFAANRLTGDPLEEAGPALLFLFTDQRPLPDDGDGADTGTSIWDESAFDIDWNSDDTEVTYTFTEERSLPTDRDSANTPDYTVNYWNDESQPEKRDAPGIGEGYFKLTDGDFEAAYKFAIATDGPVATAGGIPRVVLDTGGGTAPAPFLSGETVATLNVLIQGEAAEVRIVRTEDGKHHALDALTAHDYGLVRPDRSGFGWNFDGTPVPRPSGGQVTTQQALGGAIDAFDSRTPFADGFESGDVSAWSAPPR